jgi:hypothetical protein
MEQKSNVVITDQSEETKQQTSSRAGLDPSPTFCLGDYGNNKGDKIIVVPRTDNIDDKMSTITDHYNDKIVDFSILQDNPCWVEPETFNDRNNTNLSPQIMQQKTKLATVKNINILQALQEEFEMFSKPGKTCVTMMQRFDNEEKASTYFAFEHKKLLLDQLHKRNLLKVQKLISNINAKDSTEDHCGLTDYARNGCDFDDSRVNKEDVYDGDNSSIASSSSSAFYAFFDDVSFLTNEQSVRGNDDTVEFDFDLDTFDDMTLFTDNIENKSSDDIHVMVCSLDGLSQDHHNEEEQGSVDGFVIVGENIISKEAKKQILHDFVVGFSIEEGFSPNDELRLA